MRRAASHSAPFGIMKRYKDALGNWRQTPPDTYAAIVDTMSQEIAEKDAPLLVVRRGQRKRLKAPAEIIFEDGGVLNAGATLPRDLPLGYHRFHYLDGDRNIRLIVSSGECFLPKGLRVWGWSAQLYALRSSQSWGMGDFANLRRLAWRSAREFGAGVLLVNWSLGLPKISGRAGGADPDTADRAGAQTS